MRYLVKAMVKPGQGTLLATIVLGTVGQVSVARDEYEDMSQGSAPISPFASMFIWAGWRQASGTVLQ